MFQCHVCGNVTANAVTVNEVFQIDSQPVFVEHIPAQQCAHCGETTFSQATTEAVRRLVHGAARPVRAIQMPVFEFA